MGLRVRTPLNLNTNYCEFELESGPIFSVYLPIFEVAPFVISHVALGAEALPTAVRAWKGPLVRMNSNMNPQILLLRESLGAAGALKRLRAHMHMHVGCQAHPAVEDSRAAGELAYEFGLLSLGRLTSLILAISSTRMPVFRIFLKNFRGVVAVLEGFRPPPLTKGHPVLVWAAARKAFRLGQLAPFCLKFSFRKLFQARLAIISLHGSLRGTNASFLLPQHLRF